jgi:hypothetical protein
VKKVHFFLVGSPRKESLHERPFKKWCFSEKIIVLRESPADEHFHGHGGGKGFSENYEMLIHQSMRPIKQIFRRKSWYLRGFPPQGLFEARRGKNIFLRIFCS